MLALLDGIDLREVEPQNLQKRIGVIFQDFVKYFLPARENVGFGQIDQLRPQTYIATKASFAVQEA